MQRFDGQLDPQRLTEVAVYRRDIGASLERIWENVLDWEHLPWLHASAFSQVELLATREDGWRARVRLRTSERDAIVETHLDFAARRYLTLTAEGIGAGTEIWTGLEAKSDGETAIEVTFLVPDVAREQVEAFGAGYRDLYAQLWDEDEVMMQRRQSLLGRRRGSSGSAPVALGPLGELRAKLPLCADFGGRRYRVVDVDGELVAHATVCPHLLGPLDELPLEEEMVRCPWHGYRFDVRSGHSCEGHKFALASAPRVVVDDDSGEVSLIAG